jgi:hypothetical protein
MALGDLGVECPKFRPALLLNIEVFHDPSVISSCHRECLMSRPLRLYRNPPHFEIPFSRPVTIQKTPS